MRIVLINGQNHKGSTYHIGRMLAEKIAEPKDIKEIFLPKDMPNFCCGCTQCFMKDEKRCPHYAVLKPLTDKIDEAEVLIFTSPVYVFHTTGSMKAFLDHYGYRWMIHRPAAVMFHKQAVIISTAAGAGMKSTCKDIADSCFYWGISKIYKYGIAVNAISWKEVLEKKRQKIEKKTTQLAAKVKKRAGHVTVGIKTKMYFNFMRIFMQKMDWNPLDTVYWKENGWDKKKRPWKFEKTVFK